MDARTPGRMVMGRVGRTDGTGMPGPMAGVGRPVCIGGGKDRPWGRSIEPIGVNVGLNGLIGGRGEVGLNGGDPGGENVTLSGLVGGEVRDILDMGAGLSGSANGSTMGFLAGMNGGCMGRGAVVSGALVVVGGAESSVVGVSLGAEPVGCCCTTGADVTVPIGGRGGAAPIGGRGRAPPMVETGLPPGGGVGVLFSEFSELPLEMESSSDEVVGGVFLGTFFPPLGPFPFSAFHEEAGSWGRRRGSSLAGFRPTALTRGTEASTSPPP